MAGTDDNHTKTRSTTLPLDDPRWWSNAQTLQYCLAQPLFRLADLVAAVRQEKVACKFEYRDERTQPAQRKALLLTVAFFEREADIDIEYFNSAWVVLKPRREGVSLRPYTLSFWEPDLKKLWTLSAEVPSAGAPSPPPPSAGAQSPPPETSAGKPEVKSEPPPRPAQYARADDWLDYVPRDKNETGYSHGTRVWKEEGTGNLKRRGTLRRAAQARVKTLRDSAKLARTSAKLARTHPKK